MTGVISDPAVPQADVMRRLSENESEVAQNRTARRAEHTSVGRSGIRVTDQGSVTVDGGGNVVVQGGGYIEVRDLGALRARYPSGRVGAVFGPMVASGSGVPAGHGLLVRADADGAPNILFAREDQSGATHLTAGNADHLVDNIRFLGSEVRLGTTETPSQLFRTYSGDITIVSSGEARFGGVTGTFVVPASATGTANARIDPTTGRLHIATSSRRFKRDIADLEVDPDVVLQLRPRTWAPGPSETLCPDWMHGDEHGECDHSEPADPSGDVPREVGFIAEELHDLGLNEFVEYDDAGPRSIAYDRLTAALIPLLRQQQDRIDALEARVSALERGTQPDRAEETR